ncbi:MAG: UTP--glucose-1-phosphate uridylyltransferase [Deltaproteobacteria bacterium]|nr:UTP--glucose-1-phosphate uridylyltransferase [Deltaproteobacteria bacterium]
MDDSGQAPYLPAFIDKMKKRGLSPTVIDTFVYYYKLLVKGETGLVCEEDVTPIGADEFPDVSTLASYEKVGRTAYENAVMIVLNGGLGTSMGLSGAKSLIEVKDGRSFLEITLNQAARQGIKLCFMNSFNTHQDTLEAVDRLNSVDPPLYFLQNKFPKILREDLSPACWPQDPHLEWNPPGHGDIYTALYSSGTLERLLGQGITYAFISNSDNLGATLDDALLGYFVENRFPFMMEISQRGPLDVKGGHLVRLNTGQLILREIAQCPERDLETFQNIHYHCFFNTNNIWLNLEALKELLRKEAMVRLPMILNPKPLDPRDASSPAVYQIETAMGSAISLFQGATAVKVGKNRFLPVKTTDDLLVIRSDRYLLTEDYRLVPNPETQTVNIAVKLDPKFFGKIDQFDSRFPDRVPSLIECESLTVEGDVRFEANVTVRGNVKIINRKPKQAVIKEGTIIEKDLVL